MSEYIGSKVKVKCKKNGDVIGYVKSVTDDEIILTDATSYSLPGVKSKCLILNASEILDLDLVQDEVKLKSESPPLSLGDTTTDAPSTKCAYVCPTTPVRPMRPMRARKTDDVATYNEAVDNQVADKSQDSVVILRNQKQQALLKPQPQNQVLPVFSKQSNQYAAQPVPIRQQQPKVQRERNDTSPAGSQVRRRAFSANYETPQHVVHGVGRGADFNVGQPGVSVRRASRGREPWFDMSVSAMQEEFDFEGNLQQFDKSEFYRQVDAESQRQNVSPITVRNRGMGDMMMNPRNLMRNGNHMSRKNSRPGRDSCFDMDVSQMNKEFDFEGNLAQFNKSEFYREVDERRQKQGKISPETVHRRPDVVPEPKFRHDENILSSSSILRQPITLPSTWPCSGQKYRCPDGLTIPACPVELRQSLITAAETLTLSWASIAEMYARAVTELILDQVGGKTRLRPNNDHQLPHVVVLAGNHLQGSLGVAVARHLSSRRCAVSLVIPPMRIGQMDPPREMVEQMKMYRNLTGEKIHTELESCPKTMDFVVSAIESHEESKNELLLFQPWISQLITFCNANRPPCLVVDPPPVKAFIRPRLMVGLGLPLTKSSEQATYYICDVGLTTNVYQRVGITYVSPFTCRSILQLTEIDDESEASSSSSIHH